jgi:hypothetical protein
VLELHPSVKSQVFKQDGRTSGQAALVIAAEADEVVVSLTTTAWVAVEVKVEVLLTRTVETEVLTTVDKKVDPATVWVSVAVTGEMVVDSSTITVVTTWLTAAVVTVTAGAVAVVTACAVEVKVETRVTRTVEVVLLKTVDRTVDPATVCVSVAVTGQMVVDSSIMTVVTTWLAAGAEVATTALLETTTTGVV